ncbi:MAG: BatD family protein, partial [Planctomycetota bacterium]
MNHLGVVPAMPVILALVMMSGGPLYGQRAQLRIESERGYINQPLRIQVDVTGLEEKSQPQVELVEAIDPALTLTRTGVTPQISSSITNINGRITRESSTRWLFSFEVLATEVGTYPIGPFKITQDGTELTTASTSIQFGEVELDDRMQVELEITERDYFVGERAAVRLRWSYTGELDRLGDVAVRAPLFDRFEMTPVLNQNQTQSLPILTKQGTLKLPVTVETRGDYEQETAVLEGEGQVLLNQVGEFSFAPVSATAQYVTQWSRNPRGQIF